MLPRLHDDTRHNTHTHVVSLPLRLSVYLSYTHTLSRLHDEKCSTCQAHSRTHTHTQTHTQTHTHTRTHPYKHTHSLIFFLSLSLSLSFSLSRTHTHINLPNTHTMRPCRLAPDQRDASALSGTGVLRSYETEHPYDPTVGLCIGPNGDPGELAFSHERGTSVRARLGAEKEKEREREEQKQRRERICSPAGPSLLLHRDD